MEPDRGAYHRFVTTDCARKWVGKRLIKMGRAVQPSVPEGPPLGAWRDQWDRISLGLARIEHVYEGRPEPEGGTAGAAYDVFTFFVSCHHLVDWIESDETVPRRTRKRADRLVCKSGDLSICADLANRTKHCSLTGTQTGDTSTGPSGNAANVMIGRGASHAFRVSSAGVERDARELARSCVAEWTRFLTARGLPMRD